MPKKKRRKGIISGLVVLAIATVAIVTTLGKVYPRY